MNILTNSARLITSSSHPGCIGITRDEQGLYHLHNGQTLIQDQGYITYLIGGQSISSNGYLWDYRYHFSLHGYDSNAQYRSASEAFAACIRSKTCLGVTQERPGHFRLNTHRVPRPHGSRECWIKGNQQVKAHCKYSKTIPRLTVFKIIAQ